MNAVQRDRGAAMWADTAAGSSIDLAGYLLLSRLEGETRISYAGLMLVAPLMCVIDVISDTGQSRRARPAVL